MQYNMKANRRFSPVVFTDRKHRLTKYEFQQRVAVIGFSILCAVAFLSMIANSYSHKP